MGVASFAYFRLFEPLVAFNAESRERTTMALRSARLKTLPEWYLSLSYVAALGSACIALASLLIGLRVALLGWGATIALSAAGGLVVFFLVRLGFLAYPRIRASSRATRIDAELPGVVMLSYALARGGTNALGVFRAVAQERDTYGEISLEFDLIVREVDQLGKDVVSALHSVAATTPSAALRSFLEGIITILNSGADVRDYFRRQAEEEVERAHVRLERDVEQAGMLAETYVSALLVLPLLLIVVLTTLSALGDSEPMMIYLVAFGLLPIGTLTYLVLVDMMMPAPPLVVPQPKREPLLDFGMAALPSYQDILPPPPRLTPAKVRDEMVRDLVADAPPPRWHAVMLEWTKRRMRAAWTEVYTRSLLNPLGVLPWSAGIAIGGLLVFAWLKVRAEATGLELGFAFTNALLLALLVAFLPIAVFHELRSRTVKTMEASLPDVLSRMAGFNEKGVSLLKSFQIMGRVLRPPLGPEFLRLDRDVGRTGNLRGALRRMRARIRTRRMSKLGILFDRAIAATGNIKEVLKIAAADASSHERLRVKKTQAMMSYVAVIYVVFAVFLYVILTITDIFYGANAAFAVAAETGAPGLTKGIPAANARLLFFQAVLIQGAACGLVAGKLGEAHILSGIKHAAIISVVAWGIFTWVVLL